MLLDKFQYLSGDTRLRADITMFNFPVAQLCHVCIVGWDDANSDLRRLAEVWSIERNRRNRPTPQPLAGFLAQTFEGPIFHHNASLSDSRSRSVQESCSFIRSPRRRWRARTEEHPG